MSQTLALTATHGVEGLEFRSSAMRIIFCPGFEGGVGQEKVKRGGERKKTARFRKSRLWFLENMARLEIAQIEDRERPRAEKRTLCMGGGGGGGGGC